MSVITKRGDDGFTDRLFGGRVHKSSPVIEAIGTLDELNAVVGLAAAGQPGRLLGSIQPSLVSIMGELSAGPVNSHRYDTQFGQIGTKEIEEVEQAVAFVEAANPRFDDWQTPSSQWDVACRVSRRAERAVLVSHVSDGEEVRLQIRLYLNRLSDYLWVLGRPQS